MLLPIGLPSANQITYFCFLFFKTSNLSVILIIYGEFGLLTLLSPSWVLYFWWWALGECRLCYKFKLSCASLSSKRNVQIFHNLSSLILKPAHRHRSHLLWIFRYRLGHILPCHKLSSSLYFELSVRSLGTGGCFLPDTRTGDTGPGSRSVANMFVITKHLQRHLL